MNNIKLMYIVFGLLISLGNFSPVYSTNGVVELDSTQVPCPIGTNPNPIHQMQFYEGGPEARAARTAAGCPEPPTTGGCEITAQKTPDNVSLPDIQSAAQTKCDPDSSVKVDTINQNGDISGSEVFPPGSFGQMLQYNTEVQLQNLGSELTNNIKESQTSGCPVLVSCDEMDDELFKAAIKQPSMCNPSKIVRKCMGLKPNQVISFIDPTNIQKPPPPKPNAPHKPINNISFQSWLSGSGAFGAGRPSRNEYHMGVDIFAPYGTQVYSMYDNGVITNFMNFYNDSWIAIVKYTNPDGSTFYVNYCEIQGASLNNNHLHVGSPVNSGTVIGNVGHNGVNVDMLHLEFFNQNPIGLPNWRQGAPQPSYLINPTSAVNNAYKK